MTTLKKQSRRNCETSRDIPTDDYVQIGCLQRIADSLEKMEEPYCRLLDHIETLRNYSRALKQENETLRRKVAAYKGIVRKQK